MKISWNWLREILPVASAAEKVAAILTDIGLEVESAENFAAIKGDLEGLIVGEVISCEKHPDADKLKLTKVNTGNTILSIVCGAPNVATGQKVIVAPIGTAIYPLHGEAFTIKKAKIRGAESEGMLCAADEIGLSEDHNGLYLLPQNAVPGSSVKELFSEIIYNDIIFEIGLTANHADANSHFGVARELYAALISREIEPAIERPELSDPTLPEAGTKQNIKVNIEAPQACLRYSGILLKNITIQESPAWMQHKLKAIGVRSVNAVVDITNYILHETGQPMHAFDADKIQGDTITVKTLPEATAFITLDGKERKLHDTDLMICDEQGGICIAGVYGGLHSGITDATKNVFLESASFDPLYIRRTEAAHGLKTDASSRFAKGTDAEITLLALRRACALILDICGGEIASDILDVYPSRVKPFDIFLRYSRLEMMGAMKIPQAKIEQILHSLQIEITEKKSEGLQLKVPAYKNDVIREIDIIEEILRIYGYDNIPSPQFVKTPYTVSPKPDREKMRLDCGRYLAENNFYELFTNSITRSKYTEQFMPEVRSGSVMLLNSLNAELDMMRQTMLFSGLEVIQWNYNRRQTDLKLFEFGKVFFRSDNTFIETEKLSIFITGNKEEENWNTKTGAADYFDMKLIVEKLFKKMGFNTSSQPVSYKSLDNSLLTGTEIFCGDQQAGYLGMIKETISRSFDIRQPVYFAEINWQHLTDTSVQHKTEYREIGKYPEIRRDISLILPKDARYESVMDLAKREGKKILKDVRLFDVFENEKLEGKKSYAISLQFGDDNRTLTDAEVDTIIKNLIMRYEIDMQAIIRK